MFSFVTKRAFYLPSPSGDLAAFYFQPEPGVPHVRDILYAHPFGLELPQSRTVMAYLWRSLAATGVGVLAIDLPGCGDSSGDFGDATWEKWVEALETAWQWLRGQSSRPVVLCGARLGAALAMSLAAAHAGEYTSVILLSPVLDGEQMMTRFLRLRVAFSGLRDVPEKRETTQEIRKRIALGECVEVAGYFLNPQLVASIDALKLPPPNGEMNWIETMTGAVPASLPTAVQVVRVKPFWTHTRGDACEYEPLAALLRDILKPA